MGLEIKGRSLWYVAFDVMGQEDSECFSTESVKKELEERLVSSEIVNQELFWEQNLFEYVVRYRASPVLMAICMGEYNMAKKLIEKGYPTVVVEDGNKIVELTGLRQRKAHVREEISLGQYLLGVPDMPDDFRLFLWRQIAKEKSLYSKRLGIPRGKVIDFSMISFRGYDGMGILSSESQMRVIFPFTVLQTIRHIADVHPEYLKNAVDYSWREMLSTMRYADVVELVKCLLEKVNMREKVRLRLLKIVNFSDLIEDRGSSWFNGDGISLSVVHLYKIMLPHYSKSERVRKALRISMIGHFMNTYRESNRNVDWLFDKKIEKQFIKMMKSLLPKRYSFEEYLTDYRAYVEDDSFVEECIVGDWSYLLVELTNLFVLYSDRLGYKICLRDEVEVLMEEKLMLKEVLSSGKGEFREQSVMGWISYVDKFYYKQQEQLNYIQRLILEVSNYDFIQQMLDKNLLRGKQIQLALDYCMRNPELHKMIPCILVHDNKEEL